MSVSRLGDDRSQLGRPTQQAEPKHSPGVPCSPGLGTGVDTGRLLGAQPHVWPYLRLAAPHPVTLENFKLLIALLAPLVPMFSTAQEKLPAGSWTASP